MSLRCDRAPPPSGSSMFCSYFPPIQVLPLENKMKTPKSAKSVVYKAMIIVTLLYFVFGTTGYVVYGDALLGSITLNLKSSTRLWASM